MRMHCKSNHSQGWKGDKTALFEDISVQSFFCTGGLQKYFVVDSAVIVNAEHGDVEQTVQAQLAEYKSTQQEVEKELQVLEDAPKTDRTGWFKRTGWLEFFKD
jgi:hypothetical protein